MAKKRVISDYAVNPLKVIKPTFSGWN